MLNSGRLCAVLLLVLWLPNSAGAQRPPANLHQVGDHWSAWDPPADHAEGSDVYHVQPGDSLWKLAEQYLGDPYLWPQIWERNKYIQDSHWIYPGDPLVMATAGMPMDEVAALPEDGGRMAAGGADQVQTDSGSEDSVELRLDRRSSAPQALGSEDDIYCSGFIGADEREFDRRIIGSEYENLGPRMSGRAGSVKGQWGTVDTAKLGLYTGDIVYLDGGEAAGLLPGTLYTVVSPRERIRHPVSGEPLGRFYQYSGRLRVLSVQAETAIGEIVRSCEQIFVGATLQPFEQEPIPLARRPLVRGVNDPTDRDLETAPTIVRSVDNVVSLGQGHVVFIDRGADQEVVPGDIYTIYRLNDPGLPPVVVGELGILTVQDSSATGKILESRYSVHLGDRLEIEAY